MKRTLVLAITLLVAVWATHAQRDTTSGKKARPRNERKKIIGKDTAGYPHNRTPQWPHDSMRKNTNNVERLNNKKDTVNTMKRP